MYYESELRRSVVAIFDLFQIQQSTENCHTEPLNCGYKKALKEHNLHLPIISFDNLTIVEYIGLSTVNQPMHDMGFGLQINSSTENLNEVTT